MRWWWWWWRWRRCVLGVAIDYASTPWSIVTNSLVCFPCFCLLFWLLVKEYPLVFFLAYMFL